MNYPKLCLLLLGIALSGCADQDQQPRAKTFGGHLGDSYNQMMNDARATVELSNQQMRDSDQRMQDLRQ